MRCAKAARTLSPNWISGHPTASAAIAYGRAHERDVWREFSRERDSSDFSHWLFEGYRTRLGRPADLGYWIGYRVAKAYYDNATDKRPAVRDILRSADAPTFLAASGYAP